MLYEVITEGIYRLSGDALLHYEGQQLSASDIEMDRNAGRIKASGGIRYSGSYNFV